MATAPNVPVVEPALLFIPDISGFTKFVNDTEILHSQHIIQELLEILIDSNRINLVMNEIEGDAILFYRPGQRPPIAEILQQVETMYIRFHQHLLLYEQRRICHCGACESAVSLQLKIVAHYGEITESRIKDRQVLFGKEVIMVHRLLKNNIGEPEYILLTGALLGGQEPSSPPGWFESHAAMETYDAGEVQFSYALLAGLRQQVPPPEPPNAELSKKAVPSFTCEALIESNMNRIFDVITDLNLRPRWMDGIKTVEWLNHEKINRAGTQHVCIAGSRNNPVIVTESATRGEKEMELVEMHRTGMGGCRFRLQKTGPEQARLFVEVLVSKNPFIRLFFNMAMKNKFRKSMQRSVAKLKAFCENVKM